MPLLGLRYDSRRPAARFAHHCIPARPGLDPGFSWEFLRLFESQVLPALRG